MVAGVTTGGQVGVIAMTALRYAQADGQQAIMPVRPSQLIYANFKHIQVRPDARREDGVPLYKLKILDTLIDKLSRKDSAAAGMSAERSAAVNADSIDTLITNLSRDLRGPRGAGYSYRAGFLPEPGAFVDLVA